ncbi:MAG: 30S ribosomal protein S8 [Candidatus Pacebacteria bacterium]|nr:30S ribosomal protein S8 [Candidatus Paceibacterota bacterium]
MSTDLISDLIIQLKNAGDAGKETLSVSHSDLKASILELLAKSGYIASFTKRGKKVNKFLDVVLAKKEGMPRISGVKRLSHVSSRQYKGVADIRRVKQGHGMMVLTTPKGILSDVEARKEKVGGEALFEIW